MSRWHPETVKERFNRYAQLVESGPIPDGHQVHHVCVNRACVNPSHLEAVVPIEHAQHHRVEECIHGHAFTPENTRTIKGKRHCKRCDADRQAKYRSTKVAA